MAESNFLRSFEVHTIYDYVYSHTVRSLWNISVNGDGTSQKLAYVLLLLMIKIFDKFFMKLYSLFCQPGTRRTHYASLHVPLDVSPVMVYQMWCYSSSL
jgi:hypothetical protein